MADESDEMKLTPAQALRVAEDEQRTYVGTVLAAVLVAPSVTRLPAYQLLLGDIAGRMEAAAALARFASELERAEEAGRG